jgi:hypothetical protein
MLECQFNHGYVEHSVGFLRSLFHLASCEFDSQEVVGNSEVGTWMGGKSILIIPRLPSTARNSCVSV